MSKITNEEKHETKKRIQAAAREVFAQKGIQKASIREIAKKAGVGASTLYGYYESKSLLFIETIFPTIEKRNTIDIRLEELEISGMTIDEVSTILADTVFSLPSSLLEMDQEIIKEFHIVLFSVSSSEVSKKRMEQFLEEDMNVIISKFIQRLIEEGVIVIKIDAVEFAGFILSLMRAVFLEYIIIGNLSKEACYTKLRKMIKLSLIGKI
jgi:AcrR family transcriptional regulator